MTSMNVSVPEKLKRFVEEQTKRGCSTPSEHIRELIGEDQKRKAKEKFQALLLEGEAVPVRRGAELRIGGVFHALNLSTSACQHPGQKLEHSHPTATTDTQIHFPRKFRNAANAPATNGH